MKWRIKPHIPEDGEVRTRRVFAWLPTIVNDHKVWLETYEVTERFQLEEYGDRWVVTKKTLLYPYPC